MSFHILIICNSEITVIWRESIARVILNEEVNEYQEVKNLDEIVDVLELLFAICEARGFHLMNWMQSVEKSLRKEAVSMNAYT